MLARTWLSLPVSILALFASPLAVGSPSLLAPPSSAVPIEIRSAADLELTAAISNTKVVSHTFEGFVFTPNGKPAEKAVVVSSAGGQAVTGADGRFRIEVRVLPEAESIQITAVGGPGGKLVANQAVSLSAAAGLASVGSLWLAQTNSCTPSWLPTFGGAPGLSFKVEDFVTFDDGAGEALYAAGPFSLASGVSVNGIAKWDGENWESLGSGLDSFAYALAIFDDGSGPALFVGGKFTEAGGLPASGIAKWDGSNWSALGSGVLGGPSLNAVQSLTVFDDGNGDQLIAGGQFTMAGGVAVSNVAQWDGSNWSSLGGGVSNGLVLCTVRALSVYDDGGGAALYAGGSLSSAGGMPAEGIAKWDGAAWSSLGSGINGGLYSLTTFNDGNGEELIAGGRFTTAGGIAATGIAKWNGSSWSSLGSGMVGMTGSSNLPTVSVLAVFDDGNGARLIAGGTFTGAGGVPARGVARWNGTNWGTLSSGLGSTGGVVSALAVFDEGNGDHLFAGGQFVSMGGTAVKNIARWDGLNWGALGTGLNDPVLALTVFDDGSGPALFAGGSFVSAGGRPASHIVKWTGSTWVELAGGMELGDVRALTVFDDGNGDRLYAGGDFADAGGVAASFIASWDGSSWSPLGDGTDSSVYALTEFDDGTGPALYAGGFFRNAGGATADRIAKWDGSAWSALAVGVSGSTSPFSNNSYVRSLTVFDDGGGAKLYVGGDFTAAGGAAASCIASWDGSNWATLGMGIPSTVNLPSSVNSMTVFDDGNGDRLFVGGQFLVAGVVAANNIASWNGSNWAPLGSGISGVVNTQIVFDDGRGEALYAGGRFLIAGGGAANHIAKWDGSSWAALNAGLTSGHQSPARAMTVFDDGGGAALHVGGGFFSALDSGDSFLAKWGCVIEQFPDFCNGDGGDGQGCTNCPCGNDAQPGTVGGCLNSALSSTLLTASGDASVSLLSGDTTDLCFALSGAPANALSILSSGDALAPTGMANPCFGLGSGVQATAFDGLRCAALNTRRHGGRAADSNGEVGITNSPWGGDGGPPVGIANAGAGFASGQTRYFQVIHRDDPLAVCMRGLNTSQAVEVVFEP